MLELNGFFPIFKRYLNSESEASNNASAFSNFDPYISVHDSFSIEWPLWRQENIAMGLVEGINESCVTSSGSASQNLRPVEYTYPSNRTRMKARITALHDDTPRSDPVLILTPDRPLRDNTNSLTGKKVGQVLLLFKYRNQLGRVGDLNTELCLAYVRWFSITSTPSPDSGSDLFCVSCNSTSHAVIPIESIERPVHLIPKFGTEMGRMKKIHQEILQNHGELKVLKTRQGTREGWGEGSQEGERDQNRIRFRKPLDAFGYYSEFYLNSWSDKHMYENIY